MAVRNTRPVKGESRKKPCPTCPQKQPPGPPTDDAVKLAMAKLPHDQGQYLWNHVVFGTGTCVSMIEGYAQNHLPGNAVQGIRALRDRLAAVVQRLESR